MSNEKTKQRELELDTKALKNDQDKRVIPSGLDLKVRKKIDQNKKKILKYLKANDEDYNNYEWQMQNRFDDIDKLKEVFNIDEKRLEEIKEISKKYRWSISPYYLSLLDLENKNDPLSLMCIPSILEGETTGESDPMAEEYTNPAGSITRRYPDRLIINVTNSCGTYCRFCQRKRNIGERDSSTNLKEINESIEYIKNNKYIRDVLITGGDPLTLSTKKLEDIIKRVRAIKHVEIIRLGTRIPITIPQRIDKELVKMLKKYHPLYINLHFNHPKEITKESVKACSFLADAGIPLGNQTVLLKGINNNKYVMLKLCQELLKARVKPYYIFQAKKVKGTLHFVCEIKEGIEIVNFLRGNTSGLAIPSYIVNSPNGLGKVNLAKKNYEFLENGKIKLTTWEGKELIY
ncbi:MAG: KamA family radical SAM protein [Bacilli bacterium]|jgi:glutamate 2,3-aminomutase